MTPDSVKRRRVCRRKLKSVGDHDAFLARIKKSMYYGRLPNTERLSLPVTEMAADLFSAPYRKCSLQRLDLEEAADLSRSACVSPCSLVLAMLYLERLQSLKPSYIRDTPPSELYLVSLMVATKFLQDDGEDDAVVNDEWATSAKISASHLKQLEREFLDAVQWEVYVSEEAFWTRLRGLERDVALNEGARRGWFSYSELDLLLEKVDLVSLAHTLLTVSAVCLTSYTAGLLTMIASTLFVSQLQPIMFNFNGISRMSSNISSPSIEVPTTALDKMSGADVLDSESYNIHTSPVDVLTTSFILASISSCKERLGNDSQRCIGEFGNNRNTRLELRNAALENTGLRMKNVLSNVDPVEPLSEADVSNSYGCGGWLKYLRDWLQPGRLSNHPAGSSDWAASIIHCIHTDPGISQARLFPIHVY